MPGENELNQKKEAQLNKNIRVASDHHASELKKKDRSLYDQAMIQRDNQDIDMVLKGTKLTSEERSNLEMIKGRNLSSLLVLDEKRSGDSKQMKAVKKAVSAVEVKISEHRLGDPFTEAAVDEILRLYDTAILACRDYLRDKDPSYQKGQERYALVKMNTLRLHEEAEAFVVAKELIRTGVMDGMANTGRELMTQAKVYGLISGKKGPEGEAPAEELPDERTLKASGYEASMIYQALAGKEMPSDMIRRLAKSKDKKDQSLARELTLLFANIRGSLSDFREGKVHAKVFLISNMVISVHQNAFGQLCLNVGGKRLPLGRHSGIVTDMLSSDVVKNQELYGKDRAKDVIQKVIDKMDVRSFGTEHRQILTDYLVKNTAYSVTDFTNFNTHDLVNMIQGLHAGRKLYVVDTEPGPDWVLSPNDMVFLKGHGSMINVMESREILHGTQDRLNREKVEEKVTLKKQQEVPQPEWNEQEQLILNLLGDVLFSYDTWMADEKLRDPGRRMQIVLARNDSALAYLISDMFTKGELNLKMVNGMLDKMPLFSMAPEQAAHFRATVIKALQDTADAIWQVVDGKIKEVLGERPDGFALLYDLKKGAANAAAGSHLASYESLLKGVEIKAPTGDVLMKVDSLKDIILGLDDETVKKLADAEKAVDQGVNAASEMIQNTVSKYSGELFKPKQRDPEENRLPDPYQRGLSEEEVRQRKRERYEKGNKILGNMVQDSMTSGESGQGLFTKLVFENYFKGVDSMDQRSMLASMIRGAKPAGQLLDEKDGTIDEKEKKRRKAHNEKIMAESMGNYIGGLLKGAGPLFQKMMQGLPLEGLPEELQSAVKDMKSRLAPIPDEIVEAQLYSMVQRSHGQVKKIEVVKPLGAASVGQTFLCRITRADGKEEEAAIKLLKPDVTNRMMREKQLMIDCARKTDVESRRIENEKRRANHKKLLPEIKNNEKGGMQVTYEGQLERSQEELDLTVEARNVELGKIYDKVEKEDDKKVSSMKLNQLIAPTTNSMVLEKAPGETIDGLLERIKTETQRLKDLYKKKVLPGMSQEMKEKIERDIKNGSEYYGTTIGLADEQGIASDSEEYAKLFPERIEENLAALLKELKQKKAYLDIYARKWTEEGMFKEGFYHGDPHDGNIMVSDEKLTVIDFGNCTKLTEEQQGHVTRMMAAAAIGDMELFRSGLHALLKPEFETLYQQKRDELGREIKTIFKLGDQRAAGARIMVALLKAQELGLEVPSAVYNFSQGQIRLQNALDNINKQIEETEDVFERTANIFGESTDFDCTADFRVIEIDRNRRKEKFTGGYLRGNAKTFFKEHCRFTKDKDFVKGLVGKQFDGFKGSFITPLRKQAEMKDSIFQSIDFFVETKRNTPPEALETMNWNTPLIENFDSVSLIADVPFQDRIKAAMMSEAPLTDAWITETKQEIEERVNRANVALSAFDELETVRTTIRGNHKGEWKPTEEEQTRFDAACGTFTDAYLPVHSELAEGSRLFNKYYKRFSDPGRFDEIRPGIECYFRAYPEGKEAFMKAYDAYIDASRKNLKETDPEAFRAADRALKDAYHDVMAIRFKHKDEAFSGASEGKKVDFLDIMADVLDEQVSKLVGRMGIFRSIRMNYKLKQQKKEQSDIGVGRDGDDE